MDVCHTDVHVLFKDDQERLLKEVGFSNVKIYGLYDFSEYDPDSNSANSRWPNPPPHRTARGRDRFIC